ncbi:MAG: efflux RND transporter permease subunit [Elusimicrobia bacterium]|nr:efflux RND transporter permease subunit [Elusimicrobiota bacterium]
MMPSRCPRAISSSGGATSRTSSRQGPLGGLDAPRPGSGARHAIYIAFRNVYETFLIFSCVPLALVGGVLGLMLNGLPFSISAGVGFVALSGIAVLNGVVLINCFNDLHREGVHGQDLIHQGTDLRIRPVLMTALVEIFGFLPMMLSSGVGSEVQRPLASVVIGGVVSSTLLTLVVLPVLVSLLEKKIWSEKEVELMKEIKAVIKPHKAEECSELFTPSPTSPGCIVSPSQGYGRSPKSPNGDVLESDEWTKLELVVSDRMVETVLKTIQSRAHTGNKGDGKIFVIEAVDTLAIRTGKRGNEAI